MVNIKLGKPIYPGNASVPAPASEAVAPIVNTQYAVQLAMCITLCIALVLSCCGIGVAFVYRKRSRAARIL
jgi:hypothetical protein